MFNKNLLDKNLKEKLTRIYKQSLTTTDSGFIPFHLSKEITNAVRFLNPIMGLVTARGMNSDGSGYSNVYRYPKVKNLREAGNYGGETSNPVAKKSSTEQAFINLKVSKSKVEVPMFYQKVTQGFIDSVSVALDLEARALARDFLIRYLYDNSIALGSTSDKSFGAWEDSIDTRLTSRRLQKFNTTTGVAVPLTTKILDEAINFSNMATGGMTNSTRRRVFLMSPAMAIKLRDIISEGNIRYTANIPSDFVPDDRYILNAHPYVAFYANIPVIEVNGLGGDTAGTMGAFTLATAGTGSSLTAGTYYVRVSKVVANTPEDQSQVSLGETMADISGSIAISNNIKIEITIANPDPNAYYYKVYMSTSASLNQFKLVGVFRAKTYDSNGDLKGNLTQANVSSNAEGLVNKITITHGPGATDEQLLTQGVIGSMKNDLPLTSLANGNKAENIVLLDLDPLQGAGEFVYVDDSPKQDAGFFTTMSLSRITDSESFMLVSYSTPVMRFTGSSVLIRGVVKD